MNDISPVKSVMGDRFVAGIRNVPAIALAGDGPQAPTTINPGSADAVIAIYVVSGSCKISVAAQQLLPVVVHETPAVPFDLHFNARTAPGIGSTFVVAHPLPNPLLSPADGDATHCFVFTATGGGAYLEMNLGSGWDYPLTPHGSGYYNNLSTVAVSPGGFDGDKLNYTSGGTVYVFVRVDMYGLSDEPDPKHPEWNDFNRVKGSVAWAVDTRCQNSGSQGAQHMMAMREGAMTPSARTVHVEE
jgi:hypothetical protein